MEIPFNGTMWANLHPDGDIRIKAGTMVVLPTILCENPPDGAEGHIPELIFPDFLLVCDGQSLRRDLYPGWSAPYPGGFYEFTLPNLHDAFIVGFDKNGEPIMGTGCIYFKDVPEDNTPPRHQQILD